MSNNNKIMKYTLFLLALGLIAGFLLGFVNSITAPIIKERAQAEAEAALKEYYVYDGYSGSHIDEFEIDDSRIADIYKTYDENDNVTSIVYKTVAKGFSSDVVSYVEIKADGTFGKTIMIAHGDTPSYANPVKDHDFGITDASIDKYSPVLSGASYTSGAVIEGIHAAAAHFKDNKVKLLEAR